MLSRTWPEVRLAPLRSRRDARLVNDEPVLYREEAIRIALAVHDILEVLRKIARLLEDGDEGEAE
jgi:hypothetical protein